MSNWSREMLLKAAVLKLAKEGWAANHPAVGVGDELSDGDSIFYFAGGRSFGTSKEGNPTAYNMAEEHGDVFGRALILDGAQVMMSMRTSDGAWIDLGDCDLNGRPYTRPGPEAVGDLAALRSRLRQGV